MWYSKLEKKTFISRHILHQHWYTCPIALTVCRNHQHRSLLTLVSDSSASPFQPPVHQWNILHQLVNRFTQQTLLTVKRKHFFLNNLFITSFCPQKRKRERWSSLVYPSSTVAILTTETASEPAHARLLPRISWSCTLLPSSDTHKNLLHPLQLFYFQFWLIYWLYLVYIHPCICTTS
jgi:hypothetical protein